MSLWADSAVSTRHDGWKQCCDSYRSPLLPDISLSFIIYILIHIPLCAKRKRCVAKVGLISDRSSLNRSFDYRSFINAAHADNEDLMAKSFLLSPWKKKIMMSELISRLGIAWRRGLCVPPPGEGLWFDPQLSLAWSCLFITCICIPSFTFLHWP